MSKRNNLLVMPAKTAYDVDIASRVNSYIQTCMSLSADVQAPVKEGLDELNRLRRNAFLHDECGKTQSSIDSMYKYYDCFTSLSDKIQLKDSDCPVPFRWKSAFEKSSLFTGRRDLTLNYAGYEKACVLFNIAAYQSKFAASLDLSSDDDLRTAVRLFQLSANIFELLKNDIMHFIPDEIPKDMQPQLLNALAQLMITQANEAMYLKALKDNSSPSILRSIAMQLADNYENVQKLLNFEQARGVVDKSWYTILQAKQYALQAQGTKHHFDYLETGGLDSIEERLARAKEALELIEKAENILPRGYTDEVKAAKMTWEKIEKDNNLIYHARIPSKTELPPIPRKLVLNIGTVKFPLSKQFKDLFIQLVSVHVSKAVNIFQGQLKERVYSLVNDLRTSNQNVKAGLASINMPALIEDELKSERIPASIIGKSENIRSNGGFHAIEAQEQSLSVASNATNAMIVKIRTTLEAEEKSDTALRQKYGAQWNPVNSSNLTDKFKQEIGKYSGIIRNAMEADEKVKARIRLCERDVVVMESKDKLLERIPPITSNATHKSQAVDKLRELWSPMSREMNNVDALEKRVNEIKYDPTSEFLEMLKKDGSLDDQKAVGFATSKLESLFGPIAKEVADNRNMRTNLLDEMRVWHQQINSGSSTDDDRTKALQQLAAAYDAFLECQANLKEGTRFYNDLKVLLIRLQQQIDDFCFARQTEKEDLIAVLEPGKNAADVIKALVNNSSQSHPVAPPARPPPPMINRAPEMNQLNISPNQAPSVPPRSDLPSIPQHNIGQQPSHNPQTQQMPQGPQGYQPNTWYGQPQYQSFQQPYPQQGFFQQMPNLPFYGALGQNAGQAQPGFQQPYPNQPYMAPYPNQSFTHGFSQPQYPPAQHNTQNQQQPPTNNNPFA